MGGLTIVLVKIIKIINDKRLQSSFYEKLIYI